MFSEHLIWHFVTECLEETLRFFCKHVPIQEFMLSICNVFLSSMILFIWSISKAENVF